MGLREAAHGSLKGSRIALLNGATLNALMPASYFHEYRQSPGYERELFPKTVFQLDLCNFS